MSADDQPMIDLIEFVNSSASAQLSLEAVAARINLSPAQILLLAGHNTDTASQFRLQPLTRQRMRQLLNQSAPLLESSFGSGPKTTTSLYNLNITIETISPDAHRHQGVRPLLSYGIHPTSFGSTLIALSSKGLCHLDFVDDDPRDQLEQLRQSWPNVELIEDNQLTAGMAERIFAPLPTKAVKPLQLHLRGTSFQLEVWQALLHIPPGYIINYRRIAERIGRPAATRAVGQAIGQNPICYIIPCHRIIRSDGSLGGYRGGRLRKEALLALETGHQ